MSYSWKDTISMYLFDAASLDDTISHQRRQLNDILVVPSGPLCGTDSCWGMADVSESVCGIDKIQKARDLVRP